MKRQVTGWAQAGFTLIETMISLGLISAIGVGLTVKINSIKQSLKETSRIMALDALESGLGVFMRDKNVIFYSAKKSNNIELLACLNAGVCINEKAYPLSLYLDGQNKPITGNGTLYDENGQPCTTACKGFLVSTVLRPHCVKTSTCLGPAYVSIEANISSLTDKQSIRRFTFDMQQYQGALFPDLRLSCPDKGKVLRGIGLGGEPLCTAISDVVLRDKAGTAVKNSVTITPKDCSTLNTKADDQAFVSGYDKTGQITCAPRYW